jgi:hypothetical protein
MYEAARPSPSGPCVPIDLRERVRDAVRCHFDEGGGPAVIRLHYVRDEVLAA